MKKLLLCSVLCLWTILFALPVLVSAEGGGNPPPSSGNTPPTNASPTVITFPNPLTKCDTPDGGSGISCVLNKLIDNLLLLAIPVVAALVLYGAFQIMTSAGNPEKVKSGSKTIMYTAIGYAIMLLSKGVAMILRDILGA